jgi:hypothetical protein
MVRTRYKTSTNTTRLVLRAYDPGQDNTVDVLDLNSNYQFGDVYDILFLVHKSFLYVFYQDFTVPVYKVSTALIPDLATYMFKWGSYAQFYTNGSLRSGIDPTDWATVQYQNVAHWHTGWATPENYFNAPVADLGAAATAQPGVAFNRTMSVTGSGITEYKWTILSGPTGAGSVIGTSAALSWTPSNEGTYTLMGGAKNAQGWSNPQMLEVTVTASTGGGGGSGELVPAEVISRTPGRDDNATTSHTVTMPAGIEPGDQIVVIYGNDAAYCRAETSSTGWTKGPTGDLWEAWNGTSTNQRGTVFYKESATGSDTLVVNHTLDTSVASSGNVNRKAAWVIYVIRNGNKAIQVVKTSGGSASSVDLTGFSGLEAGDYRSLIGLILDNGPDSGLYTTHSVTTVPTGYDGNPVVSKQGGAEPWAGVEVFTFDRLATGVTSVDPSNMVWSPADQWTAFHILVPPGESPSQTILLSGRADAVGRNSPLPDLGVVTGLEGTAQVTSVQPTPTLSRAHRYQDVTSLATSVLENADLEVVGELEATAEATSSSVADVLRIGFLSGTAEATTSINNRDLLSITPLEANPIVAVSHVPPAELRAAGSLVGRAEASAQGNLAVVTSLSGKATATSPAREAKLTRTTPISGEASTIVGVKKFPFIGLIRPLASQGKLVQASTVPPATIRSVGQYAALSAGTSLTGQPYLRPVRGYYSAYTFALSLVKRPPPRIAVTTAVARTSNTKGSNKQVKSLFGYATATVDSFGNLVWAKGLQIARAKTRASGLLVPVKLYSEELMVRTTIEGEPKAIGYLSSIIGYYDEDDVFEPANGYDGPPPDDYERGESVDEEVEPIFFARTFALPR